MKHKWDYTQYGRRVSDISHKNRRVCLVCGKEQKKFDIQNWGRIIAYRWDGDGREPCSGVKPMTRDDYKPGDLIENDRGKRYIVGERRFWSRSGEYLWGWPATKSGKQDQRQNGYLLDPKNIKLIHRKEPANAV